MLVSPATFEAISFCEYTIWHRAIAEVLRLRATRRQDVATLQLLAESLPGSDQAHVNRDVEDAVDSPSALVELALRCLKSGKSSATEKNFGLRFKEYSRLTAEQVAEALLNKAAIRMKRGRPILALMPTLASLSIAKDMECNRLILNARVQLAEALGLQLKMPDGARLLLESDLPNCLSSDDVELRARAKWTYARMLLSCSDKQEREDLTKVLYWLREAERGESPRCRPDADLNVCRCRTLLTTAPLMILCHPLLLFDSFAFCSDAQQAECLELHTQILYYMLRLHHHLGDDRETISVTARLDTVERAWTRLDASQDQAHLQQVRQILDVVVSVAGYVASGEAANKRLEVV